MDMVWNAPVPHIKTRILCYVSSCAMRDSTTSVGCLIGKHEVCFCLCCLRFDVYCNNDLILVRTFGGDVSVARGQKYACAYVKSACIWKRMKLVFIHCDNNLTRMPACKLSVLLSEWDGHYPNNFSSQLRSWKVTLSWTLGMERRRVLDAQTWRFCRSE